MSCVGPASAPVRRLPPGETAAIVPQALQEFLPIYDQRPMKPNARGMRLAHSFAVWLQVFPQPTPSYLFAALHAACAPLRMFSACIYPVCPPPFFWAAMTWVAKLMELWGARRIEACVFDPFVGCGAVRTKIGGGGRVHSFPKYAFQVFPHDCAFEGEHGSQLCNEIPVLNETCF